tara:strand:+ start:571 stop:1413 length:843 start_codon:yes stop_codon:yes gene_type:complete
MRDNSKRTSAAANPAPAVASQDMASQLVFSTPTELVDLPSKGRLYPEGHPLHNAETVEIKFMTAKDEDILTSPSLLKKGLAITRFLQNILIDKSINVGSLLSGDKNAILIAARVNGFGSDYRTKVTCPNCATVSENTFDLDAVENYDGLDFEGYDIRDTGRGTFIIKLPKSGFDVEVKPMTSREEDELLQSMSSKRKIGHETNLTDQLRKVIVSINGVEDATIISQAIAHMPAYDSRYVRSAYAKVIPAPDMTQHFACPSCGFEKEVDIPMTVDFFWSKQ